MGNFEGYDRGSKLGAQLVPENTIYFEKSK